MSELSTQTRSIQTPGAILLEIADRLDGLDVPPAKCGLSQGENRARAAMAIRWGLMTSTRGMHEAAILAILQPGGVVPEIRLMIAKANAAIHEWAVQGDKERQYELEEALATLVDYLRRTGTDLSAIEEPRPDSPAVEVRKESEAPAADVVPAAEVEAAPATKKKLLIAVPNRSLDDTPQSMRKMIKANLLPNLTTEEAENAIATVRMALTREWELYNHGDLPMGAKIREQGESRDRWVQGKCKSVLSRYR
jgi:hypothetical protein